MSNKNYQYFDIMMASFVAILLISNIVSTKIVAFWGLSFDGGTLIFPLSYILGDVLTEVYGYAKTRRAIWVGFFMALLMSLVIIIVGVLPPAGDWPHNEAYQVILGLTPRIVLASLCAFLVGNFSNSFILSKMKIKTKGKMLWARTIGSTLVGEGLDTVIFILVAFAGVLSWELLGAIMIFNYFFKCGVEIVLTPLTYKVVSFLKKQEGVDVFDDNLNYNPLSMK